MNLKRSVSEPSKLGPSDHFPVSPPTERLTLFDDPVYRECTLGVNNPPIYFEDDHVTRSMNGRVTSQPITIQPQFNKLDYDLAKPQLHASELLPPLPPLTPPGPLKESPYDNGYGPFWKYTCPVCDTGTNLCFSPCRNCNHNSDLYHNRSKETKETKETKELV